MCKAARGDLTASEQHQVKMAPALAPQRHAAAKTSVAKHLNSSTLQHLKRENAWKVSRSRLLRCDPRLQRFTPPAASAAPGSSDNHPEGRSTSSFSFLETIKSKLKKFDEESKNTRAKLQSLGLAGVVTYGLFNTAYYTCTFLFVWMYVAQVPTGNRTITELKK